MTTTIAITRNDTLRLYEKNGDGGYHERLAMTVSPELTDAELIDVTTWAEALLSRARLMTDSIQVDINAIPALPKAERKSKTKPPTTEAVKPRPNRKQSQSTKAKIRSRYEAPDYTPDLGSVTGRIILALKELNEPVTTKVLAEMLHKPTSHMSATITGLRDRGMISVEQDPDDGTWKYGLTSYAHEAIARAQGAHSTTDLPSVG